MKILSIGNSFSQDAQRYLHAIELHSVYRICGRVCEKVFTKVENTVA